MELREAIDKLFEMTSEQRSEIFGYGSVAEILDGHYTEEIIELIENFYSEPKYGDVYSDKDGHKVIVLDDNIVLSEECETPQYVGSDYIAKCYTKTGKNVAYELRNLFK